MSLRQLRKQSVSFIRFSLFAGIAVLLGSSHAFAQTSQVSGQVLDASHAVVAAAELTLTRVETGDTRQEHSTNEGYYSFPLLLPGHYDLKIDKSGYETQDQKGIIVETGAVSTVNIVLVVGAVAQTIDVDATVQLLQTQSSAVEDVVENQTITNMPLIDRRSSQLQRLSGFVVGNGTGQAQPLPLAADGEIMPITWSMAEMFRISCSAFRPSCLTHRSSPCRSSISPSATTRPSWAAAEER